MIGLVFCRALIASGQYFCQCFEKVIIFSFFSSSRVCCDFPWLRCATDALSSHFPRDVVLLRMVAVTGLLVLIFVGIMPRGVCLWRSMIFVCK